MKKGFTLIELLAVIVILAVIALIATPMILGIITKAKKGAAEASAYNYVKAVELLVATSQIEDTSFGNFSGAYLVSAFDEISLVKGTKPSKGTIFLNEAGIVEQASLCINNFEVSYDGVKANVEANNCDNVSNTIYEVYENGTAIYFNPETGLKCTVGEALSTTGTKTGCMKWYTFNDNESSNTVNLILDHNTTATVAWNSTESNVSGPTNVMTQLASDTSSWAGVPTRTDSYSVSNGTATYTINYSTYKARLITAREIATITGNSSFVEVTATTSNWFYLDGGQTQTATTTGASNYDWLFDYTNDCTSYGCNIADASNYGYWTSTAVSGDTYYAWYVGRCGDVGSNYVDDMDSFGVRPVITIPKSTLIVPEPSPR
ncbi:MAG: prepilin-type N-terminal cleavage/methylation domain-containing protein [Bacilli bacterium]|nr:prepilin-type N-terminal cleavage/methylation domain-containing protein [Bacilli bacterium]